MTPEELNQVSDSNGLATAGFIAIALFVAAWLLNMRFGEKQWSVPWAVLPIGFIASLMLYLSPVSIKASSWLVGLFNGIGNMFGADFPVQFFMTVLCVGAIVATIADISIDAEYNPVAVAALMIAPICAHNAGGLLGNLVDNGYRALSVGMYALVLNIGGV